MANAVEMSTMRKLVAQLNQYRHEYYNLNAPSVADDVYDYMYDELLALEEHTGVCMANSPTQTVGYPVVSALPKVAHDIPLLVQRKIPQIAMILLARIHIAPIRVRLCGDQMLFDGIR